MRSQVLLTVGVGLMLWAGCRGNTNTTATSDPFLRTTVPPPSTGAAAPGVSYSAPTGASSSSTPATPASTTLPKIDTPQWMRFQQTNTADPAAAEGPASVDEPPLDSSQRIEKAVANLTPADFGKEQEPELAVLSSTDEVGDGMLNNPFVEGASLADASPEAETSEEAQAPDESPLAAKPAVKLAAHEVPAGDDDASLAPGSVDDPELAAALAANENAAPGLELRRPLPEMEGGAAPRQAATAPEETAARKNPLDKTAVAQAALATPDDGPADEVDPRVAQEATGVPAQVVVSRALPGAALVGDAEEEVLASSPPAEQQSAQAAAQEDAPGVPPASRLQVIAASDDAPVRETPPPAGLARRVNPFRAAAPVAAATPAADYSHEAAGEAAAEADPATRAVAVVPAADRQGPSRFARTAAAIAAGGAAADDAASTAVSNAAENANPAQHAFAASDPAAATEDDQPEPDRPVRLVANVSPVTESEDGTVRMRIEVEGPDQFAAAEPVTAEAASNEPVAVPHAHDGSEAAAALAMMTPGTKATKLATATVPVVDAPGDAAPAAPELRGDPFHARTVHTVAYSQETADGGAVKADAKDLWATSRRRAAAQAQAEAGAQRKPLSPAAANSPAPAAAPVAAKPAKPNAPAYFFAPDYAKLQGRLEYSAGKKEWKLRYIPIDGRTDPYGGSVVLQDEKDRLAGYHAGDFVAVEGTMLERSSAGALGFAPRYAVSSLERQR